LMNTAEIATFLADVTPVAPPGTRSMYHSMSFGHILGEVIKRTDPKERQFGDFVREELCEPLQMSDTFFGTPESEEPRIARLTWGKNHPDTPAVPWTTARQLAMPRAIDPSPEPWNSPSAHRACSPGASGIMSVRSGVRLFAMLANAGELDGVRLLSRGRIME